MEQRAHKIIDDPDKNPDDYVKFFALVFDMKAKRRGAGAGTVGGME